MSNKLNEFRLSTTDSAIGGVCGGLAKYTGSPAWFIRMMFVESVLFLGIGILPYILLWIFVPNEGS